MTNKMNVLAITDKNTVKVIEVSRPEPNDNQILMKVHQTSLCTFEQRIFNRGIPIPLPYVGGHEVVGEIISIGNKINDKQFKVGQTIVARLLNSCGECYQCRRGNDNLCEHSNELDDSYKEIAGMGGLSEYLIVKPEEAWVIEPGISDDISVFAEPIACVANSIEIGNVTAGDDVLVIGGGFMGQLHILLSKLSGARVILSEPNEERREVGLSNGADIIIDPMTENLEDIINDLTKNRGVEVVFNTTPISSIAEEALTLTAPKGRMVMFSSQHPDVPFPISANWLHNTEVNVTGAVNPSIRSFDQAVNLINKGLVNTENLIDSKFDYVLGQEAFERAVDPFSFRVIVKFAL